VTLTLVEQTLGFRRSDLFWSN